MSNYINSLSNQYRYDHIAVRGAYTGFNTAKLSYGPSSATGSSNYVNSSGVQYLGGIQAAAGAMQKALNNIASVATFEKMQAVSSSAEHLTIQSKSTPLADWTSSTVSIHQLAYGQENKSNGMRAPDLYEGGLGYQQFELEVDGRRHQLFVEVQGGDTNKTVQEKMSSAINNAKLGISASVSTANGVSTLSIRSNNTGDSDANRFQLRDVTGALVRTTSVDTVHQDAQNAVYMVDGGAVQSSSTNEVSLGNGITAILRKETGVEPVTVTKDKDTTYIKEQIGDLVKSFNSLYEAGNGYDSTNPRLVNDLIGAYNSYYKDLNSVGITMGEKGLVVDEKKLSSAMEDGKLYNLMTGYGRGGMGTYGFTGRLSAISTGVRFNTGAYTGSPAQVKGSSASKEEDSSHWESGLGSAASGINNGSFDLKLYNNYMALGYFMNLMI